MNVIKTLKHKGYTIKVVQDEEPQSPREFDNLGKMVCFHKRYTLPNETSHKSTDYSGWNGLQNLIHDESPEVILPVYMYDHSGLTINTTGFSCPWDSGQIGFIFASKQDVTKEFGEVTSEVVTKVKKVLEAEVKEYSDFLEGNVYGFVVESADGNQIDSCWGFIGDHEKSGLLEQAKDAVDSELRVIGEQTDLFGEQMNLFPEVKLG